MKTDRFARQLALVILAVLPLYYFRFSIFGVPTNIIELLIALLFVLTLWQYRQFRLPYIWPIGLILIGLFLALSAAIDRPSALGIIKGWFVMPLVYYGSVVTLFESAEKKVFIAPAIFSLTTVSLYAIFQRFGLIGLLAHQLPDAQQYVTEGRAIGFFESPNFLAMYLVPLTLLVGGYLSATKKFSWLAWLILPLVAVALSESRAAILALGAGVIWLVLLQNLGSEKRYRVWAFAVMVGLVAVSLTLLRPADDQQRRYIWEKAGEMIRQHPFLGIGPGQFQANFPLLNDGSNQFASALPYALHPHNLFLDFYLSAGLIGLVGFVWLLIKLGWGLCQDVVRSPLALAASAGLLAVLVHGLFDSTYFKNDLAIIFWLLVFLTDNNYNTRDENRA